MRIFPPSPKGGPSSFEGAIVAFLKQKKLQPVYVLPASAGSRRLYLVVTEAEAKKIGLSVKKALYVFVETDAEKESWQKHQERVARIWGPELEKQKLLARAGKGYRTYRKLLGKIEKMEMMGRGGKAAEGSSEPETNKN
jgi:hypothetical protein